MNKSRVSPFLVYADYALTTTSTVTYRKIFNELNANVTFYRNVINIFNIQNVNELAVFSNKTDSNNTDVC